MSSFKQRLDAHYVRAGAEHAAQLNALFTKDSALHPIVAPAQKPITAAGLQDGFELAVKRGMPQSEAARLGEVVSDAGFLNLVNDETRFVRRLSRTRAQLADMRGDILKDETREMILQIIPKRIIEGRSPADIDAVIDAVRDFALAVIQHLDVTLEKALGKTASHADRAVGMAWFAEMSDAFLRMQAQAVAPLDSFDPSKAA